MENRCDNGEKEVGELRGYVGATRQVLTPTSRKPRSPPPRKRTVQRGNAFEDNAFKPEFEIVKL
jgi:hypothetical protein